MVRLSSTKSTRSFLGERNWSVVGPVLAQVQDPILAPVERH